MRPQAIILALASLTCATYFTSTGLAASSVTPNFPGNGGQAADSIPETSVYLIRAEKLIVRPGEVLENTSVLVRGDKIVQIGTDLELPEGAEELKGKVVCASFIDPWSALGIDQNVLNDRSLAEGARAADSLNLYEDDFLRDQALAAGVTSVRVQGGYRGAQCGLGAMVRLDPTLNDPESAVLLADANMGMSLGLSPDPTQRFVRGSDGSFSVIVVNNGMDVFDRVSGVDKLIGQIEQGSDYHAAELKYEHELAEWKKSILEKTKELEDDFKKAKKSRDKDVKSAKEKDKEFKEKKYKEDKKPKAPKYDGDKAVLARMAEGEMPLVVEVHRSAEIRNLLAGTEQYKRLRLVIAGGSEALSCASELAERGIPVIVWPALLGDSAKDEFLGSSLSLAASLSEAGVEVLLGTGGRSNQVTRDLPLLAELAIGHGMDRDDALRALTIGAATTFDLAGSLGTVELGKDADLLVLDGMPLTSGTTIEHVFCGGRLAATSTN
ncbi:MAG: imidazolonepropionase-like amidohydrolase [Planctomycetota bacterium]|jgi:imidazolonepropionase-like amidohydrolase